MPIEGFDYKEFAKNLAEQAGQVIPADISDSDKQYIVNIVYNFSYMAGEALFNDANLNFNAQQAMLVTQFIGEWSFHKSIDVIRSGINPQFRDGIMQKIAFTVFEIAKQAILKNMTQDDTINIVEFHVKKAYVEALEELKNKGAITEEQCNNAENLSNIDDMAQQVQDQAAAAVQEHENTNIEDEYVKNMSDNKILKLATLAMVLKRLPENKRAAVMKKISQEDKGVLEEYSQMDDLESKIDRGITARCARDLKDSLPEPKNLNPKKVYERLYKIVKNSDISKLSNIIKKERECVKRLVSGVYEAEDPEIPPRVVEIICDHLEEKLK